MQEEVVVRIEAHRKAAERNHAEDFPRCICPSPGLYSTPFVRTPGIQSTLLGTMGEAVIAK